MEMVLTWLAGHITLVWLILLAVFAVLEAVTVGLTSVWFAVGALAALLTSYFTDNILVQMTVFLVISLASLAAVRPFAARFLAGRKVATNADRVIGTQAVVTEEINNLESRGRVTVGGMPWTARSENGAVIPAGDKVTVLRIEGVKLYVRRNRTESALSKEG